MSKGYYQTQLIRTLCSGAVLAKPLVLISQLSLFKLDIVS